RQVRVPGATETAMGWEVYPDGLERTLVWVSEEYRPGRIVVTESGSAWRDEGTAAGEGGGPAGGGGTGAAHARRGPRAPAARRVAYRLPATSSGRCWTTLNGRTGTTSVSGSCMSTTRRSGAPSRKAATGTPA